MTQENAKKSTRWRYYIDKPFQNTFMLRFAAIILVILVVAIGVLFLVRTNSFNGMLLPGNDNPVLYEIKIIERLDDQGKKIEEPAPRRAYNAFDLYWPPIVVISLLNLVLVTIFGLFYSHSMAGPIHNIKQSLQEMIDGGEIKPIKIRKGDQFQDLAGILNQFIEKKAKK